MIRDPSDGSVRTIVKPNSSNNWGLKSLDEPKRKPKPAPTADELREHYANHGLGFRPKHKQLGDNQD